MDVKRVPAGVLSIGRRRLAAREPFPDSAGRPLPSRERLEALMTGFQTKDLRNEPPAAFRRRIEEFLGLADTEMEGYADADRQRDLSIRFHWGHDHDFGDFALEGKMRDRHLWLLSVFMDRFGALPAALDGMRVLDVGCWTGGTSLLLHALGAEVTAVEEVRKYAECVRYLGHAFGLDRLRVRDDSLYRLTGDELADAFDLVHLSGVLYHVTDPIVALRIAFDCLRDGGTCLVETASVPWRGAVLEYLGPDVLYGGSAAERNRSGWNWFVPSPMALAGMLSAVGFEEVKLERWGARTFATGRRVRHVDMLRAGLSVPGLR